MTNKTPFFTASILVLSLGVSAPVFAQSLPGVQSQTQAQVADNNATTAIQTLTAAATAFTLGDVIFEERRRHESKGLAPIIYQGVIVGEVDIDVATGQIMADGVLTGTTNLANVVVLQGAEYDKKDRLWEIGIAVNGLIVDEIEVSADGTQLVEDVEMTRKVRFASAGR